MAFPWGQAIAAVAGIMGSNKQGSQMEGATQAQIALQEEQFDYARDLYEALLRQQEPRTESSQRAMRSLSMMAGLGDPGSSPGIMEQLGAQQESGELSALKEQLAGTSEESPSMSWQKHPDRRGFAMLPTESGGGPNPEFQQLEAEIAALESELAGGAGAGGTAEGDEFTGPRDVTEMPGYQFAVDEGLGALASSGAARGMQLSGNQMEDITEFGQGTATKFRSQLLNELRSLAGFQPTETVGGLAGIGLGQAQAISPLLGQMGQIGAAQTAGQYGNVGAFLSQLDLGGGSGTSAIDPSIGGYGDLTFSPNRSF